MQATGTNTRSACWSKVCDTCNFSSAQVGALEAVPVGGAGRNHLLVAVRSDHHGNSVLEVVNLGALLLNSDNNRCSLLNTALLGEEPRRLRSIVDEDGQGDRSEPLNSEGNSESPLVGS